MGDAPAQARGGDPVTHSAALFGLLEGALVGAALGAILIASGGTAAPLVIAGAMASGASLGGAVGKFWGEHHVAPCGEILTGSPDVSVNGKAAAFVGSLLSCSQHPGPQTIVEGSGSVEINGRRSARVGDRCSCGCVIAPPSSPNVVAGGPAVMPEGSAASEVPWVADAALLVLGLAGGGALLKAGGLGAAAIAAKLGGSFFGSEVGGAGGRALGGRLFGEGSTGQAVLRVAGALVGGMGGDFAGGAATGGAARAADQAALRERVLANVEASRAARLGTAAESAPAAAGAMLDYSRNFEADLSNFVPGTAVLRTGPLERDLVLVNYHDAGATLGGYGPGTRSVKWWAPVEQAQSYGTLDEVAQSLALPPDFGPRNAVSIARVPAGTDVTFYEGLARAQESREIPGAIFAGGGTQYRFAAFDPAWIVEARPIAPRPIPEHW